MTTAQKIISLLKANLPDETFKLYIAGDPWLIGQSSLPALVVTKNDDQSTLGATQMDRYTETYTIKIVFNKKDDFGKSDSEDMTETRIEDLMNGRDANNQFHNTSIRGILRTNLTLGQTKFNVDMRGRYYMVERGGAEQLITQEGHLTLSTYENVIIPNRN